MHSQRSQLPDELDPLFHYSQPGAAESNVKGSLKAFAMS
jgi:hypothetical protein